MTEEKAYRSIFGETVVERETRRSINRIEAPEQDSDLMNAVVGELKSRVQGDEAGVEITSLAIDILRAIDLAGFDVVKVA